MTQPRIRSTLLSAGGGVATGSYRLLQVLGGGTVILKSLVAQNRAGTSEGWDVYLRKMPEGSLVGIVNGQLADGAPKITETWVVLADGDELVADIGGTGIWWWISGTVLGGTIDSSTTPLTAAALPADPA